jgi:hypothetical protein
MRDAAYPWRIDLEAKRGKGGYVMTVVVHAALRGA